MAITMWKHAKQSMKDTRSSKLLLHNAGTSHNDNIIHFMWGGHEVEKFSENLCFWDWGFGSFLLKASAVRYLLIPSIDTPLTLWLTLNQPSIGILITSGRHFANYINRLLIKCRQVIGQLSIWMLIEGINQECWSTLNHGYPKYTQSNFSPTIRATSPTN